jgi:phosphoribosylanthranilate isomerase
VTPRVKICGITRPEDAELATSRGAWAIGIVMHTDSSRYCDPERAAEIAEGVKRRAEVAGVFVNVSLDRLVALADAIPFTLLQLHGEEGPSYCAEAARATGCKIIKAARVRNAASVRALEPFHTDFHMLDAHVSGQPGGTGERFDWELAALHGPQPPLILAGGLTADNVGQAIALVRPFAVDVSSGVEAEPGIKDPERLSALFEAVRQSAVSA